ncbi:transposase [Shigella boydii]
MPGVGVRTAARLLTEVACRAFASAAHLAAYAGLGAGNSAIRLVNTR